MKKIWLIAALIFIFGCTRATPNAHDLYVGKVIGDYSTVINHPVSINLIMLEDKANESLEEALKEVSIHNEAIDTVDFTIHKGTSVQGYRLINLELEINSDSPGIYSFSEITLTLQDESQIQKKIGTIDVIVLEEETAALDPPEYTSAYPTLEFKTDLKNNTNQPIRIVSIEGYNKGLKFGDLKVTKNGETIDFIQPNETFHMEATVTKQKEAPFYVSSPRITFEAENE
ncbi:hypothetical protein CEN49_17940, partial [Fischerella thermalis CCMEE 5273]